MENIAISNSKVKSIVSMLREEKENIDGFLSSLNVEVDNINVAWQGQDALAYINKMKNDYNVLIDDFNKCLDTYIEFLNGVFNEYDTFNDEYLSRKIEV